MLSPQNNEELQSKEDHDRYLSLEFKLVPLGPSDVASARRQATALVHQVVSSCIRILAY